ncbi:MAG: VCBS repeat-containing protein [Pyrinomonadaceae bacterium]
MKSVTKNSKRHTILGNAASNRDAFAAWLTTWRQKLGYFSIFAALPAIVASNTTEARADDAEKPQFDVAERTARFIDRLKSCNTKPDFLRRQSNFRLPHQSGSLDLVSAFAGNDDCPGRAIPAGTYTAAAPYTDTGNTTGASNSVNYAGWIEYCYYGYTANGPDHVYSFTLSGRGPNPRIEVSTTSATYRPMIYVLDGRQGGCPAGTNQISCSSHVVNVAGSPGGTVILDSDTINYLPLNTPLHLFIDSQTVGVNDAGPYSLRMQDLSIRPSHSGARRTVDFEDDGTADIAVYRPSNGNWYINRNAPYSSGVFTTQFGLPNDKIAIGKFHWYRSPDIAVFRDGTWWLLPYGLRNGGYHETVQFGQPGDIPVPADYNGDGRDELAVYRNGTWWMRNAHGDYLNVVQFGLAGDKPVPADYDGDGRVDQAVYRGNGEWHLNRSSLGYAVANFGLATDKPVPADYDGDGKTDLAVYRDGVWYLLQSTDGLSIFQFGLANDIPVPDDYDGDGKTDAAVFRDGQWWLLQSTSGISSQQFGLAGDKPIPAAYLQY